MTAQSELFYQRIVIAYKYYLYPFRLSLAQYSSAVVRTSMPIKNVAVKVDILSYTKNMICIFTALNNTTGNILCLRRPWAVFLLATKLLTAGCTGAADNYWQSGTDVLVTKDFTKWKHLTVDPRVAPKVAALLAKSTELLERYGPDVQVSEVRSSSSGRTLVFTFFIPNRKSTLVVSNARVGVLFYDHSDILVGRVFKVPSHLTGIEDVSDDEIEFAGGSPDFDRHELVRFREIEHDRDHEAVIKPQSGRIMYAQVYSAQKGDLKQHQFLVADSTLGLNSKTLEALPATSEFLVTLDGTKITLLERLRGTLATMTAQRGTDFRACRVGDGVVSLLLDIRPPTDIAYEDLIFAQMPDGGGWKAYSIVSKLSYANLSPSRRYVAGSIGAGALRWGFTTTVGRVSNNGGNVDPELDVQFLGKGAIWLDAK